MVRTFGTAITKQYISGVYAESRHARRLAVAGGGRRELSWPTARAGGSGGRIVRWRPDWRSYTGGVGSLSSGLAQLNGGAASLGQLSSGVASYTGGVSQLSAALSARGARRESDRPAQIRALTAQLAAAGEPARSAPSSQTTPPARRHPVGHLAERGGRQKLAAAGPALVSGAQPRRAAPASSPRAPPPGRRAAAAVPRRSPSSDAATAHEVGSRRVQPGRPDGLDGARISQLAQAVGDLLPARSDSGSARSRCSW